ncbi:MAG TPA: ribose-5-phosphate isomerase RpiA [Beijerinckiaceae bacterium]|nr:ribose-5-phosphate isomerase RpiA [Beijerinckiaceae bacterium]HVB88931.1 ribose-5-phosphate isomerase RpiA [Beijerinckiaceae bacterium]
MPPPDRATESKRIAADRAADFVRPGMRLGLGTGSTVEFFLAALGARVRQGLSIVGVPTSERTRLSATALGIPLSTLDETPELDLTVDGADEFDPRMRLIKGGGGALLREKIVAAASARMIVIADASKQVECLGCFPLPVEVSPFGLEAVRRGVAAAAARAGCRGELTLRTRAGHAFVTDGGHHILDCAFGAIPDAEALARELSCVPGALEHGLFIGMADAVILADGSQTIIIGEPG